MSRSHHKRRFLQRPHPELIRALTKQEKLAARQKGHRPGIPWNKYHATPTEIDGHRFPSKGQAGRYVQLKLRLDAGDIADLRLEVPFRLEINGVLICTYRADFVYVCRGATGDTVEDFKGVRTPIYKLKKRLMMALLGIEILET